ncbi:MAG: TetR/AcrR family transcriptional regulator [Dehalococcoidia bacterium]
MKAKVRFPKTSKPNRKDARLKQIVKTAAALFYKNGYRQTTTRQIAEVCGISQGNLYYYIKSKDDFFDLFVQMTTDQIKEYDQEIRDQMPFISYSKALTMKIKEALILQDTIQDTILFWYRESRNMSRRHLKQLIKLEYEANDLLRNIIEAGRKKGEFKIKDSELAAYYIVMLEHMWALKRWHLRKHYTLDEYIRRCQDAALGIVHSQFPIDLPQRRVAAKTKRPNIDKQY